MTVIDTIYPFLPLLQYPGTVLTVCGYYLLGSTSSKYRKLGFELGLFGNIVWIMYAVWGNNPIAWGIVITNILIFAGGIRGKINNTEKLDPEEMEYMKKNKLL